MKRALLILLPVLLLLLAAGCDRFSHEFRPPEQTDFSQALFTPLGTAFANAGTDNLQGVMAWYTDDYLHFGATKEDRRQWMQDIYALHGDAVAQVTMLAAEQQADTLAIANWRLVINTLSKGVLADSTFTGERLVKRSGKWMLKGNQMSCSVPNPNQRVILEYFTFLGCPNCPEVEAKLHDLQVQYPDQLSYVEHHTSPPLWVPGEGTYAYYGSPSVPSTVFQGQNILSGSATETLDSYAPIVANLASQAASVRYSNILYTLESQTLSGSVRLTPLVQDLSTQDLVLNVLVIDKVSTYTNTQGENLRNVVRGKSTYVLSSANLDNPIPFNVAITGTVPDDAHLVIFAQKKPSAFANASVIYSGAEIPLISQKQWR